jgi:mRNA-degrading endonuclease toxin of MazEF toxin-antitoxin module
VVILSRNSALGYLATVIVAGTTTSFHHSPGEVALDESQGLPEPCVVNLHNLHTIRQSALDGFIVALDDSKLRAIENALCWALGMDRFLSI